MVKTTTLIEHERRVLQLEPETVFHLQREFSKELEVRPTGVSGSFEVKATQFAGAIVAPGLELRILPKCGIKNLFFLLGYAYRLARIRKELVLQEEVDDVREFLVQIVVRQLEDLLQRGMRREYLEKDDDLKVLRGRLLLDTLVRRAPGRELSIPCRFEDFTPDVPANQVFRHTLDRLPPSKSLELQGRRLRLMKLLRSVSLRAFTSREVDEFQYDRLNAHYEAPHQLCRILLEASGMEGRAGNRNLSSFLIDMNQVFEQFVAGWLEERLPRDLVLRTQSRSSLDLRGAIEIRPDLIASRRGLDVFVGDTKYKRPDGKKPRVSDAYQILAYCRARELRTGLLIYPSDSTGFERFPVRDGGNTIEFVGVSLIGDPAEIEESMEALLGRVLSSVREAA